MPRANGSQSNNCLQLASRNSNGKVRRFERWQQASRIRILWWSITDIEINGLPAAEVEWDEREAVMRHVVRALVFVGVVGLAGVLSGAELYWAESGNDRICRSAPDGSLSG